MYTRASQIDFALSHMMGWRNAGHQSLPRTVHVHMHKNKDMQTECLSQVEAIQNLLHTALMKALKCKTLGAEFANAYSVYLVHYYAHFTMTTIYLLLTLVGQLNLPCGNFDD